jgi:hypothetical protein
VVLASRCNMRITESQDQGTLLAFFKPPRVNSPWSRRIRVSPFFLRLLRKWLSR